MELTAIQDVTERLRAEIHKVVVGQDRALDLMLIALLSDGHVLVEGVPGVAKTLLARAFATALGIGFNRIQFTPDLMPGDVLGTNLFNFQTNGFVLTKGPIFADILVADEINRTPPKTQAALLQAMQERAVTIDGTTHPLSPAFMVIATQNPIEQEGTYPLPEAQLDRFLFKIDVGYPTRDEELTMVRVHGHRTATPPIEEFGLHPVSGIAELVDMRRAVAAIRLEEPIVDYVVDLVRATRGKPSLLAGRVASRGQHAGHLGARARGGAWPELRHPRRREGPRPPGPPPPRRPRPGGGGGRAQRRHGAAEGGRGGEGPAVISPTPRAVAAAAALFPIALLPALVHPRLFGLWIVAAALLALALGLDAVLAVRPDGISAALEAPRTLAVGEPGAAVARAAVATGDPRGGGPDRLPRRLRAPVRRSRCGSPPGGPSASRCRCSRGGAVS